MEKMEIRLLRADEIECRIAVANERGVSLLLFKDARVDQKILDETFTPFGWRRTHQSIDGNLYCTVEIWDADKKQWIAKQDVGTMSYSEKEKGQASDSFKRACFNWGIGRELYSAPFIWIPVGKVKLQKKGEKYVTSDHFEVKAISYNENREIADLEIEDGRGVSVFSMRKSAGQSGPKGEVQGLDDASMALLEAELARTGVAMETVLQRYQIQEVSQMTPELYKKAIDGLKRSKPKQAA